jgi:uncharacterized membrane protein
MPIHPMIVHFPIALFSTFVLLEVLWFIFKKDWLKNSSILTLFIGLLSVIPALLSGEASAEAIENMQQVAELVESHETFAKLTGLTFLLVLIIKVFLIRTGKLNLKTNLIPFILSLVGIYFLIQTGLRGGELVYKHGAGILF